MTILTILLLFLKLYFINTANIIEYIPYNAEKNKTLNSIFGTGNRLKDITYRSYCAILCNQNKYSDDHCCEGNTLNEMKCLSKINCDKLTGEFKDYVVKIALTTYFTLLIITSIVIAIVFYKVTSDNKYKCVNCYSSFIIVICSGLLIPICIIEILCCYKHKTKAELFGADFDKCGINNLMQSVEVKESKRVQLPELKNESGSADFQIVDDKSSDKSSDKSDKGINLDSIRLDN